MRFWGTLVGDGSDWGLSEEFSLFWWELSVSEQGCGSNLDDDDGAGRAISVGGIQDRR